MGLLGAHISIAGGVENAPLRGKEIDCDSIQIFTANQTRWKSKPYSEKNIALFRERMAVGYVKACVSHDSYLINLGSPKEEMLEKSRAAFLEEVDRCEQLGIPYIIFHPGSHLGAGEEYCLETIAESLNMTLDARPESKVVFLLETTAGQGTNVGYRFEHLRDIIAMVADPDRMGVCFDTCHVYSAGYDISTEEAWNNTMEELDKVIGLEKLRVFHVNDTKKELSSRVDRHAKIGSGLLTMETFWSMVNDKRFQDIPMVLETPANDYHEYGEELKILRSLIGRGKDELESIVIEG